MGGRQRPGDPVSNHGGAPANIGDLIVTLYAHFLELYGDSDLASVATAAVVNDLLAGGQG